MPNSDLYKKKVDTEYPEGRKAPNWILQGATIMPIPDDAVYDPVCQRFQLVASQIGVTPESLADAIQETSKKLAQGDCDE